MIIATAPDGSAHAVIRECGDIESRHSNTLVDKRWCPCLTDRNGEILSYVPLARTQSDAARTAIKMLDEHLKDPSVVYNRRNTRPYPKCSICNEGYGRMYYADDGTIAHKHCISTKYCKPEGPWIEVNIEKIINK